MEKTVSEAIEYRRSVRRFDPNQQLNTTDVQNCIREATLAPTSSNLQLWEFYHITSPDTLKALSKACFGQSAASSALQLVIPIVRKDLWKKRAAANLDFLSGQFDAQETRNAKQEQRTLKYYNKLVPTLYREFFGIFSFARKIVAFFIGLSRPMYQEVSRSDLRVIGHKSTALAAENFMISMAAKRMDTCPMEGFDSNRVKKILGLPKSAEISMIIGCGYRDNNGIYGARFRVPFEEVYRAI
ncbi:MAG: nitroreductase family protein [Flavobacteriaceae bacterium]|nr:nitroreductase family protein [Flavobacteriaceae bacterium]